MVPNLPLPLRLRGITLELQKHLAMTLKAASPVEKIARYRDEVAQTVAPASSTRTVVAADRRRNLDVNEFLHEYVYKNKPVVLEGAAAHWPAVKKWSNAYFCEQWGDDDIPWLESYKELSQFFSDRVPPRFRKLGEILPEVDSGKSVIRFYQLFKRHPEALADIELDWIDRYRPKSSFYVDFQIFIAGKRSYTEIHNALRSNLFVQLVGHKKWLIYPPDAGLVICPTPNDQGARTIARHDDKVAFNPFEEQSYKNKLCYDGYKALGCYEADLAPGDVLYNPPYFWHTVRGKECSISIGSRFIDFRRAASAAPLYLGMDFLLCNPPLLREFQFLSKSREHAIMKYAPAG